MIFLIVRLPLPSLSSLSSLSSSPSLSIAYQQPSESGTGAGAGAEVRSSEVAYVLANEQGVLRHGWALPADLPTADEVVGLVEPEHLSWHKVALPPVSAKQLPAALMGLLEETLLDDPEQLHLALGPKETEKISSDSHSQSQRLVQVAVCHKGHLLAALNALNPYLARPIARIVPRWHPAFLGAAIAYAEPLQEDFSQRGEGEGKADGGLMCRLVWADETLVRTRTLCAEETWPPLPEACVCYADGAVLDLVIQKTGKTVSMQSMAEQWRVAALSSWNLAQMDLLAPARWRSGGAYTLGRRLLSCLKAVCWTAPSWRISRWIVCGLLGVNALGLQVWSWRAQHVQHMAAQAWDEAQKVQKVQETQKQNGFGVNSRGQRQKQGELEPMLTALLATTRFETFPQSVDFSMDQGLQLKGMKLDPAVWSSIQTLLAVWGYQAELNGDVLSMRVRQLSPDSEGIQGIQGAQR
jgi:general secretion pathway protein L